MPQSVLYNTNIDVATIIGKTTFPFGLSFLLPIFVLTLVKEKEDRILVMMRMNGLSATIYFIAHYFHFLILQVVCSLVFIIIGALFKVSGNMFSGIHLHMPKSVPTFLPKLKFFTMTQPAVYLILLLLWANMMIALSFLLSIFFSKSRFALCK
jgi:hypothetical protein